MPGPHRVPIAIRFWRHVKKTRGCWLWVGARIKGRNGELRYGSIGGGGQGVSARCAHRVSWEIHFGVIPNGMYVLHKCDEPACVRPDHLFLGTVADNNHDRDVKGRQKTPCGEAHWNAKLRDQVVATIRQLYKSTSITQRQLARQYGISERQMWNIINYKQRK